MKTKDFGGASTESHRTHQSELNDLVRNLNLSKNFLSEWLAFRLNGWNFLDKETTISFIVGEDNLVYCTDVDSVLSELGDRHDLKECRLFLDSFKLSLKVLLLHIGTNKPSILLAYAVHMKQMYDNKNILLSKVQYQEHS